MEKAITAVSLRQAYSAEVWRTRIASCRSSGRSVKTWCAEESICVQTYYRWERKLLSEAGKQRKPEINGRFAELPQAAVAKNGGIVAVIRVKGMESEIHDGISEQLLQMLVKAMNDHA